MKTCLTFNGEKFSSDMELDSHLFNEFYGKVTTESGDYSYSVDFQQTTLNTIESISKKVPTSKTRKSTTVDEDGGEYSYDSANCPGVTTFTQT
jgi:hypothetical protein